MRVISQDGTMDFPYENSIVFIDTRAKDAVFVRMQAIGDDEASIMADYSTEEKAKKAMEMLRERHTDNVFCREDIQYKAEIMLDKGLDIVREMMMKCEYFRFPKDDEVKA